jgi:hypothetical protein
VAREMRCVLAISLRLWPRARSWRTATRSIFERSPSDVPSLQPSAAHSCPHPFDDEIPFEFCDGAIAWRS